jgi:hypothetical protein
MIFFFRDIHGCCFTPFGEKNQLSDAPQGSGDPEVTELSTKKTQLFHHNKQHSLSPLAQVVGLFAIPVVVAVHIS